jgi:hypothetical protein
MNHHASSTLSSFNPIMTFVRKNQHDLAQITGTYHGQHLGGSSQNSCYDREQVNVGQVSTHAISIKADSLGSKLYPFRHYAHYLTI